MVSQITKIVKTQTKGMITIPKEFRQQLGIDSNSLLEARVFNNGVLFVKVDFKPSGAELYSDKEIDEWLTADQLDVETANKVNQLLAS